ncbi:hypothetical protein G5646_21635, partial [Pectobacterium atrosepticum]
FPVSSPDARSHHTGTAYGRAPPPDPPYHTAPTTVPPHPAPSASHPDPALSATPRTGSVRCRSQIAVLGAAIVADGGKGKIIIEMQINL